MNKRTGCQRIESKSWAHVNPQEWDANAPLNLDRLISDEVSLQSAFIQAEISIIGEALRRTNGVKKHAADLMRINRTTLLMRMRKLRKLGYEFG
jgi:transcriptional regulator with PAS, ATPase and Fis domain